MMQVIPIRMIMQVESPDDYISRVRRSVAEQIRQDSIARKNFWMDGLKGITVMLLLFAFAVLVLAGLAAAEPQPVDGGWHRSDEVPVETPTAAPPDGEQHSPDEEPAPSRIDADAAATTAAEPQPGDGVSDADAAATIEEVVNTTRPPYRATAACGLIIGSAVGLWLWMRRAKR